MCNYRDLDRPGRRAGSRGPQHPSLWASLAAAPAPPGHVATGEQPVFFGDPKNAVLARAHSMFHCARAARDGPGPGPQGWRGRRGWRGPPGLAGAAARRRRNRRLRASASDTDAADRAGPTGPADYDCVWGLPARARNRPMSRPPHRSDAADWNHWTCPIGSGRAHRTTGRIWKFEIEYSGAQVTQRAQVWRWLKTFAPLIVKSAPRASAGGDRKEAPRASGSHASRLRQPCRARARPTRAPSSRSR